MSEVVVGKNEEKVGGPRSPSLSKQSSRINKKRRQKQYLPETLLIQS
jgi:hypothetical protein